MLLALAEFMPVGVNPVVLLFVIMKLIGGGRLPPLGLIMPIIERFTLKMKGWSVITTLRPMLRQFVA